MRRFLLLAAAVLTAACSQDPNVLKKKYLEAGDRYFAKQRYREASIMYRTAIRKDPRFGEAYSRNARALVAQSRFGEAEASLRRAVELLPEGQERNMSRVQLADIYLAYMERVQRQKQMMAEVERLCDAILAADPKSFDGHRLRGTLSNLKAVEYGLKFPEEASDALRSAIVDLRAADAIQPYKPEVVSALTRAFWANKQPEEAENYLKGLLRAQPGFASAYAELARFYTKNNRLQDAEDILQRAIANLPQYRNEFLTHLAQLYQQTGSRIEMVKTLERLKAQASGSPVPYQISGRLFLAIGDPAQAIQEFEAGVRQFPKEQTRFQKLIVETLTAQGRKDEAGKLNERILKDHPEDADALAWQADYFLQSRETAKAIGILEAILRRDPAHTMAHYNLGRALLAAGRQENARFQLSEAMRGAPQFIPPRIALAKVQMGAGEFGNAVVESDNILAIDPKHGEARVLRAIALRGLGKLDDARIEVKTLIDMYPHYNEGHFQLGAIEEAEHRWKEAEAAYRKSYEVNPASVQGLLAIADLRLRRNEVEPALDLLRTEVKKYPERLDLRLAHASMASRAGKREEAIAGFNTILAKSSGNRGALGEVNLRLGELYIRTKDIPKSIPHLEEAKRLRPGDPVTLHALGVAYDATGRKKEASELYQASLKINSQNPVALNNLAYYIAQNGGDLDQALTFAQRARQANPGKLSYADTVAYIYLKKHLVENAMEILEDLVRRKPDEAAFHMHLGEALLKRGEPVRGRKELQAALTRKPSSEEEAKIRELLSKDAQ